MSANPLRLPLLSYPVRAGAGDNCASCGAPRTPGPRCAYCGRVQPWGPEPRGSKPEAIRK